MAAAAAWLSAETADLALAGARVCPGGEHEDAENHRKREPVSLSSPTVAPEAERLAGKIDEACKRRMLWL